MEAKNTAFERPTHEEVREMFRRAKAWYQEVEERAHAMYEEEQRLKREARKDAIGIR